MVDTVIVRTGHTVTTSFRFIKKKKNLGPTRILVLHMRRNFYDFATKVLWIYDEKLQKVMKIELDELISDKILGSCPRDLSLCHFQPK